MSIKLRPWQDSAINRALKWLVIEKKDKRFLINAAPGAGKTICASVIAKKLIEINEIEKVIVIAPKREVVKQWKEEFRAITNRIMLIETGSNKDDMGLDLCSTWNSVESNLNLFQTICEKYKTLVVCDEHHHAAINAVWGNSANQAFDKSKFVIVLTGTPIRTDGLNPVWFNYSEDGGQLTHPQEGTYTLTYGEAVDLKYCRPAFFHRHEGKFTVVLKEGGETLAISGSEIFTGFTQ